MNYVEELQKTIDFIEENLKESISIEDCAYVAGFSKFHFHRLFSLIVGHSVMEYIRKRRLYYAMVDVLQGTRILDVALEYGYSSERTFSRAFQQEFGQVPSSCRNIRYSIPAKPILSELLNPLQGGFTMDYCSEVKISKLNSMIVASAKRVSDNPEDEAIAFMANWAEKAGIENSRRFGFDVPVTEDEQSRGLRGYEYWVSVDEIILTSEDVTFKNVEECKYAVVRITDPMLDPFERIPLGWKKLASWVDSKGYKTSCEKERFWLEEVQVIDGIEYMDIYFPIE